MMKHLQVHFKFFNSRSELAVIPKIQDYIATLHDEHRWVGMVLGMNNCTQELQVKFMTSHGVVSMPTILSTSGRT